MFTLGVFEKPAKKFENFFGAEDGLTRVLTRRKL